MMFKGYGDWDSTPCCFAEMAFPELTENYIPMFWGAKKVNGINLLRIDLAIAEICAEKLRLP